MRTLPLLAAFGFLGFLPPAAADAVKDREGAVRSDRDRMEGDARWIYNDVARGFAEAKASGRPLLVVLRCVPCLACMGIDAAILESGDLAGLLDRFVCVRLINANDIDLTKFQFDYDLSFSTLLFHGDGTVIGRYGSWQHQKDQSDATLAGYRAALNAALALHDDWARSKSLLASKQGGPIPFRSPLEIPGLAGKYGRELDWKGKVVQSCVHCHQIGDAFRSWHRSEGRAIPDDLLYPMPAPETVGLQLDSGSVATVTAVTADSPAAAAGIRKGDRLMSMAGAPLISGADVAWALHRQADTASVGVSLARGAETKEVTLSLPSGWRRKADISRRVGTWGLRAMALGGLQLEAVAAERRRELGIAPDAMALAVLHAGEYGAHAAAKNAGFRKGDILTSADGLRGNLSESELIGSLLRRHLRPARVPATVQRDGQTLRLELPVQ